MNIDIKRTFVDNALIIKVKYYGATERMGSRWKVTADEDTLFILERNGFDFVASRVNGTKPMGYEATFDVQAVEWLNRLGFPLPVLKYWEEGASEVRFIYSYKDINQAFEKVDA